MNVSFELLKLFYFYTVWVLEVVVEVNQEVREDLVSDKSVIVKCDIKVSKEEGSFLTMFLSDGGKILEKLSAVTTNRVRGVKVNYLKRLLMREEILEV